MDRGSIVSRITALFHRGPDEAHVAACRRLAARLAAPPKTAGGGR